MKLFRKARPTPRLTPDMLRLVPIRVIGPRTPTPPSADYLYDWSGCPDDVRIFARDDDYRASTDDCD